MKCPKCNTKMKLSPGWVPSYSNPDNFKLEPSAEPYCPRCAEGTNLEGEQPLAYLTQNRALNEQDTLRVLTLAVKHIDKTHHDWEELMVYVSKFDQSKRFDCEERFPDVKKTIEGVKSEEYIDTITERFLGWELPKDFNPDAGISFEQPTHSNYPFPTGTNLFDFNQAKEMIKYILNQRSSKMEKYKGYNVPDVGEFVSKYKEAANIRVDYCDTANCGALSNDCKKCLFTSEKSILQWHEARVKAKENK